MDRMDNQDLLRCGAAQIAHRPFAGDALLNAHLDMIASAAQKGVGFLVFPECSLTGYPADLQQAAAMALPADDAQILQLAEASSEMVSVIGFVERGADDSLYNAMAWVFRGAVMAVHRKINLPTYGRLVEGEIFAPGTGTTRIHLPNGWQCGGLICADFWDPGLAYLSALARDAVLAVPFASTEEAVGDGFSNADGWLQILRNHALVYGMPVVASNWTGAFDDMRFWGGSAIVDAKGNIAACGGREPDLILADIALADTEAARRRLPTIRDLSPAILRAEIQGLMEHDYGDP